MSTTAPLESHSAPRHLLQRLHAALMPDYNRKATLYWWAMVLLGAVTLLYSAMALGSMSHVALLQTLAGAVVAALAGFFPVRVPRSKNSFAAGEVFIFLVLLLHAMAFSIAYFVVNTVLVTLVIYLKRNERPLLRELFGSFGWIAITYAGSATVAGLLYLTVSQSGPGVLMAVVPIVGLMLATLHFFFRQQAADEAVRRSRVEAAEREAQQAARHVRELRESEQRFHSAFTHASIGMALVAPEGTLRQVNRALRTLLGQDEAGMLGLRLPEFVCAEDAPELMAQLRRVATQQAESTALELRCRHRDGTDVWVALNASLLGDAAGEAATLIVQVQDISARRLAEQRLQHIAFHDSLTGLPNRTHFHAHLAHAVERHRADPSYRFAVMFLDFDRFKLINDSMGHSAGDEFLVQVARRIRVHVRPGDVVARLGGDEFAVLCENIERDAHAVHLAERLQQALRQPVMINGTEITSSASIGITSSSIGYRLPEELLRDADIAMYQAKAAGKARHAVFDAGLHQQLSDRVQLEGELRRALDGGRLSVAYQPLHELGSGRLTGFEALARWHHPVHGEISPATFIPIAEESALIGPLTDLVLERACRQLRQWHARGPQFQHLRMQVNVSGNDLAHSGFAQRVTRAIVGARLAPERLTLELTENVLMDRVEQEGGALSQLAALRELGVGLSVDDFGTGYSSLSYLSTLPIDSLKIDASFVRGMQVGSKESEVVRAIVSLGSSLGKRVIAEGIETESQLMQLREMGCESGQGFHLSRPMEPAQIDTLLDGFDTLESASSALPLAA